ncbi:MAG TPA: CusA/CzcA family heavy metal efflux RND transporter, partial [Microscillaceae bacterium]|nr:CusA/CzcA family heavy metal efflux RND transporter [Microscillaceae bacterium]
GLATSLEDIGNIVIKINNRVPILVKDVADVEFGFSIRYGALTMDGKGEVVGGIILMRKGENGSAVIQRVKDKIKLIEKDLPEGLMIESFLDRQSLVSRAIGTVMTNLVEGALIVVGVILLFLGNWRASLLAASVIPLAMLFAFIMMQQFGVVGNLMSLGAIDFGLLVDPAIIVVETVVLFLALAMENRLKEKGTLQKLTYTERQDIIIEATAEVKKSVVFGGLIILIVYFPLFTLTGIEGKMFVPMAKTVSFAITGALLLAITYVPMMSALIIVPPKSAHHGGISEWIVQALYRGYEPLLKFALRAKLLVVLFAIGVLFAGYLGFSRIGGEFIPKLAEGDFVISVLLPVGTSPTETMRLGDQIEKELIKAFPDEIAKVVSKIGTSEIPTDPQPLEYQEFVVNLTDKKQWKKGKNQEDLAVEFEKVLRQFPGLVIAIQQPIENRVNELMGGSRTDVSVKLFGEDLDTLSLKGKQILDVLRKIEGVTDIQEVRVFGLPQLNVKYNREQMAFYGITTAQINRTIQTAFAGTSAGIIYENEKRFALTLRLGNRDRQKVAAIGNLVLLDKDGQTIPLKEVAEINEDLGPTEIGHENLRRRLSLGFNIRGRDLESVVTEAIQKIDKQVIMPMGYKAEFGGEYENFRRAKERLGVVVPIALLIIFGLLFSTFGTVRDSLLIYTVVPLSAVGGIFSLLARGMNFSISAGVGFIALFGIAVLNGILLVGQFNALGEKGIINMRERILLGVSDRFRPVLMTSAVAALGFLPMALSNSAGAEVQRPLATVVIGGLFTATLLTLVVLPVLYALFNGKSERDENEKPLVSASSAKMISLWLVVGAFITLPAQAQNNLTLEQAINLSVTNNPEMKVADQRLERETTLLPATYRFDNPMLLFEAPTGQDLRPGLLFAFQYPGVYVAQRRAQLAQIDAVKTEKLISNNNLVYKVRNAFNDLLFLDEKIKLLKRQDSVYSDILRVNDVRLRVGEITNLEKINGESQYRRISYNLQQAQTEYNNTKIQLALLMGSPGDTTFTIEGGFAKLPAPVYVSEADTSEFAANPLLTFNEKMITYQEKVLQVERRKRLPGLFIGYLNQGNDASTGFVPRLQLGISLPIWFWANRSGINSAKKSIEIAQTQQRLTNYQLGTSFAQVIGSYKQQVSNLEYLETTGLRQAREILRDARESFRLGSIGYYAYLQNIELSFQIEQNYLETLHLYNQAIITINFLEANY